MASLKNIRGIQFGSPKGPILRLRPGTRILELIGGSMEIDIDLQGLVLGDGEITVNEDGIDVDFRVEGESNPNMLVIDAGTDSGSIGGAVTAGALLTIEPGQQDRRVITSVGLGLHLPLDTWDIDPANAGGTVAVAAGTFLGRPTWTDGLAGLTTTIASTFYIENSPDITGLAGGTAYSVYVANGTVKLEGPLDAANFGMGAATPVGIQANTTDLKDLLVTFGFLTDGAATPLDLDAGALNCGSFGMGDVTPAGTQANTADLKGVLVTLGLVADSAATPLDLDDGAFRCGDFGMGDVTPADTQSSTTDLKDALVTLGIIADTGATPLDLDLGSLTANTLISEIASGTPPLVVASNTVVANLNASLLEGEGAAAFQDVDAVLTDLADVTPVVSGADQLLVSTGAGAYAHEAASTLPATIGGNIEDLDTLGTAAGADVFIVSTGAGTLAYEAAATLPATIGGVIQDLDTLGAVGADGLFLVGTAAGVMAWEDAAACRTTLGLVIGTDVQAEDVVLADLAAITPVVSGADQLIVSTGAGAYAHEAASTLPATIGGNIEDLDTLGVVASDGQVIIGTGSGAFEYSDHGDIAGLGDDDHSIYVLADGTRTIEALATINESTDTPDSEILRLTSTRATRAIGDSVFVAGRTGTLDGTLEEFGRVAFVTTDVSNVAESGAVDVTVPFAGASHRVVRLCSGTPGTVFNPDQEDINFVLASPSLAIAFEMDAGRDSFGFGGGSETESFINIIGGAVARTHADGFGYCLDIDLDTFTDVGNGALAHHHAVYIGTPTISTTNTTGTTSAATLYIQGAPAFTGGGGGTAGLIYGLHIDDGGARVDGTLVLDSTILMSAAASRIRMGATSFAIRDNADAVDALLVTDAGIVTALAGLIATAGGLTVSDGASGMTDDAGAATHPLVLTNATATQASFASLALAGQDGSNGVNNDEVYLSFLLDDVAQSQEEYIRITAIAEGVTAAAKASGFQIEGFQNNAFVIPMQWNATAGVNVSKWIFNPGGIDMDFEVQGSAEAQLFNTDAANDCVGIGGLATSGVMLTVEDDTDEASAEMLRIRSTRATRVDLDELYISFLMPDSGGTTDEWGVLTVYASDITTGADADAVFQVETLGAGAKTLTFRAGHSDAGALQFGFGSSLASRATYSESNVTTDRTYDANATTLNEIADVLGTLIADLRTHGVVL